MATFLERLRCAYRDLLADPKAAVTHLARSWVTVSLAASSIATVFDLAVVIALVQLARFDAAAAAPLGLFVGSTVNFAINKIWSFKDSIGRVHHQYLRFLGGTVVAAAAHAGFVYLFTDKLGVHYVISKIVADLLVFTVGNLVLLRLIVFPKNAPGPGDVAPSAPPTV